MSQEFSSLARDFTASPHVQSALELALAAQRHGLDWPENLVTWVFDWQQWLQFEEGHKDHFAQSLFSQSSLSGWTFKGLIEVQSNAHKTSLVLGQHEAFPETDFHLIPCGVVELGFDFARPLQLPLASLDDILHSLAINENNLQSPQPPVKPFDDLADKEILASLSQQWKAEFLQQYFRESLRETFTETRTATLRPFFAEVAPVWNWDGVKKTLTNGFRLPSHDEWEYICAGGTRTLFSWGDDHREARGKDPNGFGLKFSDNSYDYEICDGDFVRGGDGGGAACGGQGYFYEQLTSSPYFAAEKGHQALLSYWQDNLLYRRVFPLIPETESI